MQYSGLPTKFSKPFGASAASGYIRAIPDTTTDPNAASFTLGFPPNTFVDPNAGGSPPDGRDWNGILYQISAWIQYVGAGATVTFDAAVAAAGGYPKYALLASTTAGLLWLSTADNNTTNPDGGSPANWLLIAAPKASSAEVLAGAQDGRFVTPAGLAGALGASPTYITYPNGILDCWGKVLLTSAVEPVVALTFPTAFINTDYNISLTPLLLSASTSKDTWVQAIDGSKTVNGCSVQYQHPGTPDSPSYGLDGFYWRAVGAFR